MRLGEFRGEKNAAYGATTDPHLTDLLLGERVPGGRLLFWTGSFAYDKAAPIAEALEADGRRSSSGRFASPCLCREPGLGRCEPAGEDAAHDDDRDEARQRRLADRAAKLAQRSPPAAQPDRARASAVDHEPEADEYARHHLAPKPPAIEKSPARPWTTPDDRWRDRVGHGRAGRIIRRVRWAEVTRSPTRRRTKGTASEKPRMARPHEPMSSASKRSKVRPSR